MALHNLDSIRQLVRPEDISELCRVLGLFVQHKDRGIIVLSGGFERFLKHVQVVADLGGGFNA